MNREAGRQLVQADEGAIDELLAIAHRRMAKRLAALKRPKAAVGLCDSPLGKLLIAVSGAGVALVHFVRSGTSERAIDLLRESFDLAKDEVQAARVAQEIRRHLEGDREALVSRVDFALVKNRFQRRVLKSLAKVPAGAVLTYEALAESVGVRTGARAVGNVMATNPLPVYLPCHRVVRAGGVVGEYGGGVGMKIKLLRAEGFSGDAQHRAIRSPVLGHRQTRIFCRPECNAARRGRSSHFIMFAGPDHARAAGMKPCRICRPASAGP